MPGKHSTAKHMTSPLVVQLCTRYRKQNAHPETWGGLLLEHGSGKAGTRQRPPSVLQQVALRVPEMRGSKESEVELIKSTSAVLRGAFVNSEAKPSARSIQGGS